jgi:hypothetical protein
MADVKKLATLNMEIDRAELKKIVESGKLTEFVNKASLLAAQGIQNQIYHELAKSALKEGNVGAVAEPMIKLGLHFAADEEGMYGNVWPHGPGRKANVIKYDHRVIDGMAGMVKYSAQQII